MPKNLDLYPLIMAGGAGTRLWPLSSEKYPKQFHQFFGTDSLLQSTIKRQASNASHHPPIIICNKEHHMMAVRHLDQINTQSTLILEPLSRNTAPAIALGALHLFKINPDAIMLILPADHWLSDMEEFTQAVDLALLCARQKNIVTFGIIPTVPETSYGYIHVGSPISSYGEQGKVNQLLKFVEKPDLQTAQAFLNEGNYLWNSGMFCCAVDVFLSALKQFQPDILVAAEQAYEKAKREQHYIFIDEESFALAPNISVDYAIMEKIVGSQINACVIPLTLEWSDVGSWSSIWQIANKDENNNVIAGDVLVHDSQNCYIHAEDRLVVTVGMDDCIIIETNDAILVANKNKPQAIRQVMNELKNKPNLGEK